MIGVTFSQGIFVYLVLWLALIAVLYLRSSRRRAKIHSSQVESHLFSCDRCHYAFLNKDQINLTRCPRCNAICIRRRVR